MKAVLFDIDNTLLMRRPTIPEKWHEALMSAGYSVTADDAQRAFAECEMWAGRQTRIENETGVRMSDEEFKNGLMNCCISAFGIDEAATDMLALIWMGRYEKHYEVAEGAFECLENLHGRGINTGIVSNNYSSIRDVLDEKGLTSHFSTIIISDEVGLYKPDPQILLHACKQLGVQPDEAMYVGDHPYDVVCANEAGLNSTWIPASCHMKLPEFTKEPMYRINNLNQFISLINEI